MEKFRAIYLSLLSANLILSAEVLGALHQNETDDLCNLKGCDHINMNESKVFIDCEAGHMHVRCCYDASNTTVLGLDLSHCSLTHTSLIQEDDWHTRGYNTTKLKILILDENPFMNYTDDAFDGMLELEYLALPSSCSCPGGYGAWIHETYLRNATVCSGMENFCNNKIENATCPSNSHCVMKSPGVSWCLCDDGFYGYKCLRSGSFGVAAFLGGTIGGTVVLAGLLWVVFRRKAKEL